LLYTEYYSSDQIKKDQIGVACGFYDVEERFTQDAGGETRRKEPLDSPRHR